MSGAHDRPRYTLFAGPNGSGKSTAYARFLDAGYDSGEYLNPDDVAKSLSAGSVSKPGVDLRAGREVIERTRSLIADRQSFVRETTLASREALRSVVAARSAGFRVVMVFVAVSSAETARWRVAVRVAAGGHDIAREDQERRFPRSLANASEAAAIADTVYFLDNAELQHRLVATVQEGTVTFLDPSQSSWIEQATTGLEQAHMQKSRNAALAELRELEGLSENLQVREDRAVYASEMSAELRRA